MYVNGLFGNRNLKGLIKKHPKNLSSKPAKLAPSWIFFLKGSENAPQ